MADRQPPIHPSAAMDLRPDPHWLPGAVTNRDLHAVLSAALDGVEPAVINRAVAAAGNLLEREAIKHREAIQAVRSSSYWEVDEMAERHGVMEDVARRLLNGWHPSTSQDSEPFWWKAVPETKPMTEPMTDAACRVVTELTAPEPGNLQ